MHVSNKMIYLFLILVTLSLLGMILGSWRIILYPYLIIIGLMILFGVWDPIKPYTSKKSSVAYIISIVYFVFFIILDRLISNSLTGGDGFIFGLTPSMAFFMTTIFPSGTIVCLLYALMFESDLSIEKMEDNSTMKGGK